MRIVLALLIAMLFVSPFGSTVYRDLTSSQGYFSPPVDQRSYRYHHPGFTYDYVNPYWFKGYRSYTHAAYAHPALYGYGYGPYGSSVSPRWE